MRGLPGMPRISRKPVHPNPATPKTRPIYGAAIAPVDSNPQYVTGFKLFTLMAAITVTVFLMLLDTTIVSTALPRITDEFNSLTDVTWYASIYQLTSAALQPLTGKIYNKFSVRWTFMAFFFVFEVGSAICGAAISSGMLIAGRAIAGIGGAGLINGGLTIIATSVPLERRASLTGMLMGLSQLGIVSAPLIGGALTTYTTWRWCFYINLPVGAFAFVGLLLVQIPDQMKKPSPMAILKRLHVELDLVGFALLGPASVQLLMALSWGGNEYDWDSPTIIGLFCGAGGTALVWLIWDWYRGEEALIPLSMLKKQVVWSTSLTNTFLMFIVYGASFFLPIYFQAVKGVTPIMSGVYILASIITQLFGAVLGGILVERTGFPIPYAAAASAIGAISSGLYSTFSPSTSTGEWIGFQILNGFGRGLGMQMSILALQSTLKPADISIGMSVLVFFQTLGVAVLLAVSTSIFQTSLQSQISLEAPNADAAAIIHAGATHFRNVVASEDLQGVLVAYCTSLSRPFYLAAACGVLGFGTSFLMGWTDLRKDKKKVEDPVDTAEKA
ncbi:major facilitator superfamily-domain-containing protein [Podospora fimiseda]|uniref:Major facilitator superfamily-domain-containing protein n=1 Tax=Podospora fimiseda TaxID=252190 RepID=A0AAN7BM22_9PEZI|nr:major facilitator superfamily-domain-containing protein [Podospora fimiseda]